MLNPRNGSAAEINWVHAVQAIDEQRRLALAKVDKANFSWFHLKVLLVAGVGFFTDAYDLFAINIASVMLGYVYGSSPNPETEKKLTHGQELGLKVSAPVGTLMGQLLFGWLADRLGRKRMYGVELTIIIVATFGQAVSGAAYGINIIGILIVWRWVMGIGIGGDYPLSAIISSEFAPTRFRGRLMTTVFAAQGWGNFAAALIALIITVSYKHSILNDATLSQPNHVDYMWRILIGLGCVPGVIGLYFRLTIPETPRFTMDIERNVIQATSDIDNLTGRASYTVDEDTPIQRVDVPRASLADFRLYFSQWENLKVLIGTSWSWFALDIAYYGLGLNSPTVLKDIKFGTTGTTDQGGEINQTFQIYQNLLNICKGNLILSAGGLIPGYYVSFLFIDSWGRKKIQLMGFIILTILFVILGFGYDKLAATHNASAFLVFYCFANFFQNFGPNTTTFIIPGEVFPTRYRSTAHGISAASGKLGAIVSQVAFAKYAGYGDSGANFKHILQGFALSMLTGIGSTLLLPETKKKTLEELSQEEQEGFVMGVSRVVEVRDGIIITPGRY